MLTYSDEALKGTMNSKCINLDRYATEEDMSMKLYCGRKTKDFDGSLCHLCRLSLFFDPQKYLRFCGCTPVINLITQFHIPQQIHTPHTMDKHHRFLINNPGQSTLGRPQNMRYIINSYTLKRP